jgi:hypothetical protein
MYENENLADILSNPFKIGDIIFVIKNNNYQREVVAGIDSENTELTFTSGSKLKTFTKVLNASALLRNQRGTI